MPYLLVVFCNNARAYPSLRVGANKWSYPPGRDRSREEDSKKKNVLNHCYGLRSGPDEIVNI